VSGEPSFAASGEGRTAQPKTHLGTKLGTMKKGPIQGRPKLLVRKGGLEPPRFYPPDPKSGASANSATFAVLLIIQRGPKILNTRGAELDGARRCTWMDIGPRLLGGDNEMDAASTSPCRDCAPPAILSTVRRSIPDR
jgi:hypothetical protein